MHGLLTKLIKSLPATPGVLARTYTNLEFLNLQFPADTLDPEYTWILGNFCSIADASEEGEG